MKPVILILCTGNSCRSHMGEGILRSLAGDIVEARSAGSRPAGFVHPDAIKVMHEIGIDISRHESKSLEMFLHEPVHTVITVCGNVNQVCPTFPGQVERIHHGFDDPAHAAGSLEEILETFRRVRDEMTAFLRAQADCWRKVMPGISPGTLPSLRLSETVSSRDLQPFCQLHEEQAD